MWCRRALAAGKISGYSKHILRRHRSQSVTPVTETVDSTVSDISKFNVGTKIHGFMVKEKKFISEFALTAIVLEHDKTKAKYLHLFRNDTNNLFSINFRTTPKDSTGMPHILEHMVLCGSKIYPIRDPFFKMLNRSLATFMNAMTGADYTMYPFSTQNFADYRHLQQVYLDAVFQPLLSENDFRQEGWRLENAIPTNIKSELIIKGVVYNEMKGAFSENERIFVEKLQNLILPDHTYGVCSGGDPLKIPTLTYDNLRDFHKSHYHPSNCRIFSYGNFPLSPTLQYVNDKYFSHYDFKDCSHTLVPKQKRWTAPKTDHIFGRFEKMREPIEKQNVLAISLLMSDVTDIYETFAVRFVSDLLINGPNAPFYKSMIEPNFCGGFTPSTGYDTQPRDTVFTVGLQGLSKDLFDRVTSIFDQTIDEVITNGFDKKHIESVLHRQEIAIKHEGGNFGLNLLFGITPLWNHDGNVLEDLQVLKLIEKLKKNLKEDDKYLQKIVQKYFKENPHRLILTMSPDVEYEKKMEEAEKKLIHEKTKDLTDADKTYIYTKGLQLLKEQSAVQDINILPTLAVDDISIKIERHPKEFMKFKPVDLQVNKVNCNGMVYFRGILNTSDLSPEQQMLLPLFCYVINKLGTDKVNYLEFDNMVNTKTGGLNLDVHIAESLYHLHNYEPSILISSHCLEKNTQSMWDLWTQLFNITQLKDTRRFETLVKLFMANLTHGIADSGHLYAMQAAAGLVSGTAYQRDLLSGLQHISYMKRLIHISNYKAMLDEILSIANTVFDKKRLRCALNVAPEAEKEVVDQFRGFLERIPANPQNMMNETSYVTGKVWTPQDAVHCQHHVLNVPVHFCSKAILTAPFTSNDHAKLKVLAKLLSAKYLHPELREKRGAYGGGARVSADGVFTFYSYRDPQNVKTLDVFDESYKWLTKEALDKVKKQDIVEAKLGVFQTIDVPIPPKDRGRDEFLRRLTPDILERHRAAVMTVSLQDLKEVTDKYLKNVNSPLSSKVILGPKSDKMKTSERPDELWTIIDME